MDGRRRRRTESSWHLPLALLLTLASPPPAAALSSHSPQDLFAYPKFAVVLSEQGVLNETVPDLLSEFRKRAAESLEPVPALHLLRSPSGQAFLCTVPIVEAVQPTPPAREELASTHARRREVGLDRGLELIEGMRGTCLYQKQGWFTYSFCYGDQIRQFHEVRTATGPAEDPATEAYTLGQAPTPVPILSVPKYGSGSGLVTKNDEKVRIPSTLGGGTEVGLGWDDGGRYLSQRWEGGTVCDKTGLPRTVEVQFHCSTQSSDRIALIRETSICTYVMLVHTPRLCGEPIFLEGNPRVQEPSAIIECQPILKRLRESVDPHEAQVPPATPIEEREMGDPDVITIIYDPETGMLETGTGAELLLDTEPHAPGEASPSTTEGDDELARIEKISGLAKIMQQSMEDVLRQIAGRDGPRARADDEEPVVAANGVVFQGLEGLLDAVQRGIQRDAPADGNEPKKVVELDDYLKSLDAALQKKSLLTQLTEGLAKGIRRGQAQNSVFESEEHAKLAQMFGKTFDDGDDEEAPSNEPLQEAPSHDEL